MRRFSPIHYSIAIIYLLAGAVDGAADKCDDDIRENYARRDTAA